MGNVSDRWAGSDAYERYMGRWSRKMAQQFIDWLKSVPGWHWLEIGCGTGALTQAICANAAPASITACDPSEAFVTFARGALADPQVTFLVTGADALPVRVEGFDAAVAGLVLNFIPDQTGAVRAMRERLRSGGMLAAYVWDYADGMQFLRIFWEVAGELDARAVELDEGTRFPVCRRGGLAKLLESEGLAKVESGALEIETVFASFADFWEPFLAGTGPGSSYVLSLDPAARERLRLRLQERLTPAGDEPIHLTARAWVSRGYAPG